MPRNRALWLIAGAAALLSLPAAAAWSLQQSEQRMARSAIVAGLEIATSEQGRELGFRHGSHLAPDWHTTPRKDQFAKHCQVCHDFRDGEPLGLGSTVRTCAECHRSAASKPDHDAARLELVGGERPPATRESAYDHALPGHRDRACVECHSWSAGPRGDFVQPDVKFTVPASLATCADCHHHGADDPGRKAQQAVHQDGSTAAWRATWNKATRCEECHKAGAPSLLDRHRRSKERLFAHASHVPVADLGINSKGVSCAGCHSMDAAAAASTMGVEQRSCGQCHFGDQGVATTKLAEDLEVQRMPTKFSHATKGHREQCSACHPMANDASDPEVHRMYADCTKTCHSERKVPRHGAWSCSECHAHPQPGTDDEAKMVATIRVKRPAEHSMFAFAQALHPGVTTGATAVHPVADGRACADCHRQPTEGLSRASVPRPFTHGGHLQEISASTPTSACVTCHASIADTSSAQTVFAFHRGAAKDAGSCTAVCHQSPRMDVTAAMEEVQVPVFSHAQHASQPCASCHVGAEGVTDLRNATLVAAAAGGGAFSCARCHGHKDPEKITVTGGYETTDSKANVCFECHVPKQGEEFQKVTLREQRFQLAGAARQFHDKGGECRKCHSYDDAKRPRATAPIRVTAHRSLHESHVVKVDGAERRLPDVKTNDDCMGCHAWDPRRR